MGLDEKLKNRMVPQYHAQIYEKEEAKEKPSFKPFDDEFLAHHGVLGMKWGVRRWQNHDGALTISGNTKKIGGDLDD